MFPDHESVGPEAAGESGPSLYKWVTERGLKLAADGHTVGTEGRDIRPGDFLPRRLLGAYLRWFFERQCRRAPEGVEIRVHRASAVDAESDERAGVRITLSNGTVLDSDYAFLTVGHVGNNTATTTSGDILTPYPLPNSVAHIGPGEKVAVGGFGLTAMDTVAALTVGRGGRFVPDGERLHYERSGREPELLLYSRSGMPYRVRPDRHEMISRFQPVTLTRETVRSLRTTGPLNFADQIFPLVLTEMRVAYHRCRTLCEEGAEAEQTLADNLVEAVRDDKLSTALEALDQLHGPFDPLPLWDPSHRIDLADSAAYQRWLTGEIRDDLAEAGKGLAASPVKAALEAVREVRDILRDAVNFGGLEPASLDAFMSRTVPLMNRAVVGPQKERYRELLALAAAGVVRFPFGAAPRVVRDTDAGRVTLVSTRLSTPYEETVDHLVAGNAPWPSVGSSSSPLIRALHGRAALRPHLPGSSVHAADVDADLHPVGADGRGDPRLWLIGPLCEGATFYNHLIPTPGYSRAFVDAHRCVADMFAHHATGTDGNRDRQAR